MHEETRSENKAHKYLHTHSLNKKAWKKLKKWNSISFKWSMMSLVCISAECIFDNYSSSSCTHTRSEWVNKILLLLLFFDWIAYENWILNEEEKNVNFNEMRTKRARKRVWIWMLVCVSESESVNRVKQTETNMKIEMEFKLKLQFNAMYWRFSIKWK